MPSLTTSKPDQADRITSKIRRTRRSLTLNVDHLRCISDCSVVQMYFTESIYKNFFVASFASALCVPRFVCTVTNDLLRLELTSFFKRMRKNIFNCLFEILAEVLCGSVSSLRNLP